MTANEPAMTTNSPINMVSGWFLGFWFLNYVGVLFFAINFFLIFLPCDNFG